MSKKTNISFIMTLTLILILSGIAITTTMLFSQGSDNIDKELYQLVSTIKEGGAYADSFSSLIKVETQFPNGKRYAFTFKLYSKDGNKTILIYREPERERGKIILQIDDDYWEYFPKTGNSVKLSSSSRIVGNLSSADMLRTPLLEDYNYKVLDKEKTDDEIKYRLEFTPKSKRVPYGKIISEYLDYKIIRSELYSRAGVKMKIVEYSKHIKNENGLYIPRRTKISSAVNEKEYSVFELENLKVLDDIPDELFDPQKLDKVSEYDKNHD